MQTMSPTATGGALVFGFQPGAGAEEGTETTWSLLKEILPHFITISLKMGNVYWMLRSPRSYLQTSSG